MLFAATVKDFSAQELEQLDAQIVFSCFALPNHERTPSEFMESMPGLDISLLIASELRGPIIPI